MKNFVIKKDGRYHNGKEETHRFLTGARMYGTWIDAAEDSVRFNLEDYTIVEIIEKDENLLYGICWSKVDIKHHLLRQMETFDLYSEEEIEEMVENIAEKCVRYFDANQGLNWDIIESHCLDELKEYNRV